MRASSQAGTATPVTARSIYGVTLDQTTIDGTSVMSYDALGRNVVVASSDVSGVTNRIDSQEYDQSGNVVCRVTDFLDGRVAEATAKYDKLGREVRRTDALGNETVTAYDPLGRTVSTSGDAYPIMSGFDSAGRKTRGFTTRDSVTAAQAGFANGASQAEAQARPSATWDEMQWEFDPACGVNAAKQYADGSRIAYSYTDNGKKTRTTWARGAWKENSYNERNLVSGTTYSGTATPSVAYTYADSGKTVLATLSDGTSYAYGYDDRLLNTSENVTAAGETFSVNRTFDELWRAQGTAVVITNIRHSAKFRLYDSENRVCGYALTNAAGRGVSVSLAYDGSYVTNTIYMMPNGSRFSARLSREAGRRNLVTRRDYFFGGQTIYWYSTDYDLLNRPMNATDSVSLVREWLYNRRSELAAASVGTNLYGYAYDTIGNRLRASANAETNSYAANCLNQYASILRASALPRETVPQYDADGNMTQDDKYSYAYDAENRLVSVTPLAPHQGDLSVLNTYDHRHRRVLKRVKCYDNGEWVSSRVHSFAYEGNNIVLERIMYANGDAHTIENFWGNDLSGTEEGVGGVGGLLAVSIDGNYCFPCYDSNGNVLRYVSEDGSVAAQFVYDPYGNVLEQEGETADSLRIRFSTKYSDSEVGVVSYLMRFYSPGLGRWLSRDPIGEEGGENLYAFCKNNPVFNADINGESIRVQQSGKQITVVLNITIYYANNIEKRANTDLDRIARRIRNQIESHWNSQTWHYQCCTVSFRANVTTSRQVGSHGLTNDNLIAITTDAKHRSYVINMNRGIWAADNKRGSDWSFAHEAGHLMGLDDDYTDENGPNPGHDGHMMAVDGGIVDAHEVMDIIRRNNIRCGGETE